MVATAQLLRGRALPPLREPRARLDRVGDRMKTFATVVLALSALLASTAQAATVWKCQEGGRVIFSDAPCPSTGKPMDPQRLQGNVLKAERAPARQPQDIDERAPNLSANRAGATSQGPGSVCPSEQDIRNMEVSANSATRDKKDKAFRRDEIRRAQQCRSGEGNYTKDDWRASEEAQTDQGSVIDRKRKDAKERAEAMHSAANPAEGERIQRARLAEEARKAERRSRTIASCSGAACVALDGTVYPRVGANRSANPHPSSCMVTGDVVTCN